MSRRAEVPRAQKTNKLVAALIDGKSIEDAAQAAGYKKSTVQTLVTTPEIIAKVEAGLSDAAIAAGVSRAWVVSKLKEVAERCMQDRPVLNKLGQETGLFVFDASGANRSLELIGKHLRVFGDDASPTAQLGASVLRMLAQEAVKGRVIDADVVPTRASVTNTDVQEQAGPISAPPNGDPLASTQASCPPPKDHTSSAGVLPQNDPLP